MKNFKKSLIKTSSIFILGVFMVTAMSGSAFAEIKTGEDFPNDRCSRINKDGSVTTGKCSKVCKDLETTRDWTWQYGNKYKCTAKSISDWTLSPALSAPSTKLAPIESKPSRSKYKRYKAFVWESLR